MIRSRRLPDAIVPPVVVEPSILEAYLEDASGAPPGHAAGLLRVVSEAQAAAFLRATSGQATPVLFQAARSSLTGGAIPRGETVLSIERMDAVGAASPNGDGARIRVGPGVRLKTLQSVLARQGWFYPPVPTYQEAMIGGTVSTNAGGAASFKYGVTRDWVSGLRVLLADGELLAVERGQAVSTDGEPIIIQRASGRKIRIDPPRYRLPSMKKLSCGYHSADPLDLVDLFIGAEGTLGLITEVTLALRPLPSAVVTGLAFSKDFDAAFSLGASLRAVAELARSAEDRRGPDVRSIEAMDGPCLGLVRQRSGPDTLRVPPSAGAALLFEVELPESISDDAVLERIGPWLDGQAGPGDGPLERLMRILAEHGVVEGLELALPGDQRARERIGAFREAAPTLVAEELASRKRDAPGLAKVGGDLIVPFQELREMIRFYEEGFRRRGLEYAIWGHLSDGNLHPNARPRSVAEMQLGVEALLEFADEATRRGGSPLSEHGVGRNLVKQEMLRRFLGDEALRQMRAVKRALDPTGRLAPGVLFSAS